MEEEKARTIRLTSAAPCLIVWVLFLSGCHTVPLLLPRIPDAGRIVDDLTGNPIPTASLESNWQREEFILPHMPGYAFRRRRFHTDENGKFILLDSLWFRGGFASTTWTLVVNAPGYIGRTLFVGRYLFLPKRPQRWPFSKHSYHRSLPDFVEIRLEPAESIVREALQSPDPNIRSTAERRWREIQALREESAPTEAGLE